jgi:K+-sensing histidine kinase KdpD
VSRPIRTREEGGGSATSITGVWQADAVSPEIDGRRWTSGHGLSPRRRLFGLGVAVGGSSLLALALVGIRDQLGLDSVLLAFMLVSVAASAVGGVLPAAVAALLGFGLANYFFTPPYNTLMVASTAEFIDLMVFLAVAVLVGVIVEVGARSRFRAERDRVRAEWLTGLGAESHGEDSLESVLAETARTYAVEWVGLTQRGRVLAEVGQRPDSGVWRHADAGDGLLLEVAGPERMGTDLGPLNSFAATAGRLWRTQVLATQARRAEELRRIDELRASLLAAVGHDLRGPLAAIGVSAATLGEPNLELQPTERAELLAGIQLQVGRLNEIIANLLDLSRLHAGALSVHLEPTSVLTVMAGVLGLGADRVTLDVEDDLPLVVADGGLLERVVANLVSNADRYQPVGQRVLVSARAARGQVTVAVVDTGPGVEEERFADIFRPFQHFSDRSADGVGLGLAIARGFTEAMGGTLTPSPTPGGGLTMTLTLEVAGGSPADR